jgi:4-amino-4-deoxy-L-arabinose transferase-like glycosyltransferase
MTWNGYPFFHKPPLYFWLTALTYHVIGINELAARL